MRPDTARAFLACYGASMLASSVAASLFYFYVRDVLAAGPMVMVFLLLYIAAGAVGMLVWNKLAENIGVLRTWRMAMLYSVVTFTGVAFLSAGDDMAYAALCVISGVASGAEIAMPLRIARHIRGQNMMGQKSDASLIRRPVLTLAGVGQCAAVAGCLPALWVASQTSPLAHVSLIALYVGLPCILKMLAVFGWSRWITSYGDEYEKAFMRGDGHAT